MSLGPFLKLTKNLLTSTSWVNELSQIGQQEIPGDELKPIFRSCFRKIGEGVHADCVRYYNYSLQSETGEPGLNPEVLWYSETVRDVFDSEESSRFLSKRKFSELFEKLENNNPYHAQVTNQPIGPIKAMMQADKCKSVLILPVKSKNTLYGMIRLDNCQNVREWTSSDLSLLSPLVFQFRNLLERRDLEKQLQNTYRQARIGTWEMDPETGRVKLVADY